MSRPPPISTLSPHTPLSGPCNTSTGVCSNPNAANGTACSDGNACTQTDICQSATCTGCNPVLCTASDQCHVAGTCNTSTGVCSNPNAANGTACSDGNSGTHASDVRTPRRRPSPRPEPPHPPPPAAPAPPPTSPTPPIFFF